VRESNRAAAQVMTDDPVESGESEVYRIETVRPTAGGDAYEDATVVREAPAAVLAATREELGGDAPATGSRTFELAVPEAARSVDVHEKGSRDVVIALCALVAALAGALWALSYTSS